jgi:glycosyltransferase involved in cell wall biosynthesis
MNRRRVIISATELSPNQGSECRVGWEVARRMGQYHDATVLYASGPCYGNQSYQQAVEAHIREHGQVPGVRFVPVSQPWQAFLRPAWGIGFRGTFYMALAAWHRRALSAAGALHRERPFDVAHQLTPIGFREPGYLWSMDVPFVWGPIGGMERFPYSYLKLFGLADTAHYLLRGAANYVQGRFTRRPRMAARKASCIFAVTAQMIDHIKQVWHTQPRPALETAIELREDAQVRRFDGRSPLRIIWSGWHGSGKALPLLLHALHRVKSAVNYELVILGQGPQTGSWKRLTADLDLPRVTWMGWVDRPVAMERMKQSHLVIFTSLKEGTGHVVTEALGLGLPVICHDTCGMAVAITDTCGIKMRMEGPQASIDQLSSILLRIQKDPGIVEHLSAGAIERARQLSWDALVYRLAEAYDEAAGSVASEQGPAAAWQSLHQHANRHGQQPPTGSQELRASPVRRGAHTGCVDMSRRRVLICAHELAPSLGSACNTGWEVARRMGQYHDVTVLFASGPSYGNRAYQEAVEARIREHGQVPGVRFVPVSQPWQAFLRPSWGIGFRGTFYMALAAWHRRALSVARCLHGECPFEVVHQLNPMGFREPGYLWSMDVPFIWGPIGGMERFPYSYLRLFGLADKAHVLLRGAANYVQGRFTRRPRMAARKAACIFAVTSQMIEHVSQVWRTEPQPALETAAEVQEDAKVRRFDGRSPLRIIWSGWHGSGKALPLLLRALDQVKDEVNYELAILGEGPQTPSWKRLTADLALPSVTWMGWVDRRLAMESMKQAHVMAFTSLKEGTGHVVTEALSLGLPVICHDTCGMAVAITDACGIKMRMESPQASIDQLASILLRIRKDPGIVERLSAGAIERARQLSWDALVQRLAEAYDEAASSVASRSCPAETEESLR